MDELYGTINTSLLNLEGDIAELESNHLNTDFPEVQNMISALKIFINDQLSRSRAYLVEYTPQQLANSAVYADLFNANQVLVTSQSARADEFQIACEHENNRAELLEEEAAQRREEEGWWNAVAAVGTIVIGTVAIVCTAGMATPVVVTAVAAGSCSIAYGASNLVEAGQDIYYGSVGDATTVAFNPIRDTVFAGNQELYDIWGGISTTVAGFVVPVGQAYTTAKAAGSTTKAVLTATGNAILKEGAQDVAVNLASSGAGSVVMNLTNDVNASRLFGLGTGFLAGGKINSVDNATDAIRRLDDITDSTRTLDDITDVTRTLDDVTDSTKTVKSLSELMSPEDAARYNDFLENGSTNNIDRIIDTSEVDVNGRLIPGTEGCVTGGDSTKLGKNMLESMDLPRGTKWSGYQAQHVIPAEMAEHPVLQKIGIDLDDASNGLFLRIPADDISTMSRHRGYHSTYNEFVKTQLDDLDINQGVDVLQNQVHDLQRNLKYLQQEGLPLYPGQGATVDLWQRNLDRIK